MTPKTIVIDQNSPFLLTVVFYCSLLLAAYNWVLSVISLLSFREPAFVKARRLPPDVERRVRLGLPAVTPEHIRKIRVPDDDAPKPAPEPQPTPPPLVSRKSHIARVRAAFKRTLRPTSSNPSSPVSTPVVEHVRPALLKRISAPDLHLSIPSRQPHGGASTLTSTTTTPPSVRSPLSLKSPLSPLRSVLPKLAFRARRKFAAASPTPQQQSPNAPVRGILRTTGPSVRFESVSVSVSTQEGAAVRRCSVRRTRTVTFSLPPKYC